jgi:hypothetical protein
MSVFGIALARYLSAEGFGDYQEYGARGDIFYAELPEAPDRAILVMPTGGLSDVAGGTLPYDEPTVQLLIRSERGEPEAGERRAWEIYDALNGLHRVTLNLGGQDEIYLVGMTAPIPPYHFQKDRNGRHLWTLNLQAIVKRPSRHRPTT